MKRDVLYGEIPGIKEGDIFKNKTALKNKGVHALIQAGIGSGGASIVLNEGYVDDKDYWHEIIYTGHGGRDENTGKQIKDQTFTAFNLHLAMNCDEGLPIRVCRGPKLTSPYAPEEGFRYDGLYIIEEYWMGKGEDGFSICRFKLNRIDKKSDKPEKEERKPKPVRRASTIVTRLIRDSKESQWVKDLYDYQCQICETTIKIPLGKYAEGAHIHPVGRPHEGPDVRENILCLCPNCHVLFDKHALTILGDLTIKEAKKKLHVKPSHKIGSTYLEYKMAIAIRS